MKQNIIGEKLFICEFGSEFLKEIIFGLKNNYGERLGSKFTITQIEYYGDNKVIIGYIDK